MPWDADELEEWTLEYQAPIRTGAAILNGAVVLHEGGLYIAKSGGWTNAPITKADEPQLISSGPSWPPATYGLIRAIAVHEPADVGYFAMERGATAEARILRANLHSHVFTTFALMGGDPRAPLGIAHNTPDANGLTATPWVWYLERYTAGDARRVIRLDAAAAQTVVWDTAVETARGPGMSAAIPYTLVNVAGGQGEDLYLLAHADIGAGPQSFIGLRRYSTDAIYWSPALPAHPAFDLIADGDGRIFTWPRRDPGYHTTVPGFVTESRLDGVPAGSTFPLEHRVVAGQPAGPLAAEPADGTGSGAVIRHIHAVMPARLRPPFGAEVAAERVHYTYEERVHPDANYRAFLRKRVLAPVLGGWSVDVWF